MLLLLSQGQELFDNLDCLFSLDDCGQWSCESIISNASFQTVVGEYWYVKWRQASEMKGGDGMYFHFSRLQPLSYTKPQNFRAECDEKPFSLISWMTQTEILPRGSRRKPSAFAFCQKDVLAEDVMEFNTSLKKLF